MMSEFSIISIVTLICVCIIAYYLGLSIMEIFKTSRRKKKKPRKKK